MNRQLFALRRFVGMQYRRHLRPHLVETNAGPDFVIAGVQKAGTTFLSHLLNQHPQVLAPKIKELHYFDKYFGFGEKWYRSNFVGENLGQRLIRERGVERALRYEATPEYMFLPAGAKRLHAFRPDLKLVVVLRDPAARAVSQYWHMQRLNWESRPIDLAIQSDLCLVSTRADGDLTKEEVCHSYVDRGIYYPQIERILKVFNRDQLLILFFEDLTERTDDALKKLWPFLGIDAANPTDLQAQNVGAKSASISDKTLWYIKERTAASDERLWHELGVSPRW